MAGGEEVGGEGPVREGGALVHRGHQDRVRARLLGIALAHSLHEAQSHQEGRFSYLYFCDLA